MKRKNQRKVNYTRIELPLPPAVLAHVDVRALCHELVGARLCAHGRVCLRAVAHGLCVGAFAVCAQVPVRTCWLVRACACPYGCTFTFTGAHVHSLAFVIWICALVCAARARDFC